MSRIIVLVSLVFVALALLGGIAALLFGPRLVQAQSVAAANIIETGVAATLNARRSAVPPATATPMSTDTPVPTATFTATASLTPTTPNTNTPTSLPENKTATALAATQTATAEVLARLTAPKPDGVYLVGIDIAPGVWRSVPGASDNCYWARVDKNQEINDNYLGASGGAVTIRASDFEFQSVRCGEWTYLDTASQTGSGSGATAAPRPTATPLPGGATLISCDPTGGYVNVGNVKSFFIESKDGRLEAGNGNTGQFMFSFQRAIYYALDGSGPYVFCTGRDW